MRSSIKRYWLPAVLAICLVYLGWKGFSVLGRFDTDSGSEVQAFADSRLIAQGKHRYGMVEYTHYPNGPIYLLVPFLWMGVTSDQTLRLIPFFFAWFSIGFLFFRIWKSRAEAPIKGWTIVALTILFSQPGVRNWMGAAHAHSYSLSLAFLALSVAAWGRKPGPWLMFLGFCTGWMSYDFLPVQTIAVGCASWLRRSGENPGNLKKAFRESFLETCIFAGGIWLAILAHFFQNALYYGRISAAFGDLAGSAATRMGAKWSTELNPSYAEFIRNAKEASANKDWGRVKIAYELVRSWANDWAKPGALAAIAVLGIFWASRERVLVRRDPRYINGEGPAWVRVLVFAVGIFACLVVWPFLLPDHARFHFHFLQRHYFVPATVLLLLPVMWSHQIYGKPSASPQ